MNDGCTAMSGMGNGKAKGEVWHAGAPPQAQTSELTDQRTSSWTVTLGRSHV